MSQMRIEAQFIGSQEKQTIFLQMHSVPVFVVPHSLILSMNKLYSLTWSVLQMLFAPVFVVFLTH